MLLVEISKIFKGMILLEVEENLIKFEDFSHIPDKFFHCRVIMLTIAGPKCIKIKIQENSMFPNLEDLGYSFEMGI